MFDLHRSSRFFETMAASHPTIVQDIEIVHENRISLDENYHQPKHFILSLNNLLRSLLFFVEASNKNSPQWLKDAVSTFLAARGDDYQKLRYVRNVSAHQKLIVPEESLVTGLYRVRSEREYKLKLGFGDHGKPGKYAWDLAQKDTVEIFHGMLVFSSMTFIDLEHSALGECLGITRRWFFKVHFKIDSQKFNEVVDVYSLTSDFSAALLDHVCIAYATHIDVQFTDSFQVKVEEHNFVNTILEIDLFPSLFSQWWEDEIVPLNFGIRRRRNDGRRYEAQDHFLKWVYENLTADASAYRDALERLEAMDPQVILQGENFDQFCSLILVNHWHHKRAFGVGLQQSNVSASDVMQLQRAGGIFLEEARKEKICTMSSSKDMLNQKIRNIISKLDLDGGKPEP